MSNVNNHMQICRRLPAGFGAVRVLTQVESVKPGLGQQNSRKSRPPWWYWVTTLIETFGLRPVSHGSMTYSLPQPAGRS
jgi:hypothetical protein